MTIQNTTTTKRLQFLHNTSQIVLLKQKKKRRNKNKGDKCRPLARNLVRQLHSQHDRLYRHHRCIDTSPHHLFLHALHLYPLSYPLLEQKFYSPSQSYNIQITSIIEKHTANKLKVGGRRKWAGEVHDRKSETPLNRKISLNILLMVFFSVFLIVAFYDFISLSIKMYAFTKNIHK